MNNSVKIYTSHHKPSAFLNAAIIKPLHVGKANSYNEIGCPGDDTGDNISFKNPFYCELRKVRISRSFLPKLTR